MLSAFLSAECKVLSAEWEESAECKVLSAEWSIKFRVPSSEFLAKSQLSTAEWRNKFLARGWN
uniref:Uncharacterized protein n=1 Tax=Desertifilum tharense IPPAS B-1220 TaxID=1781255 RepID=A0A1E5QIX9_9CYAN|nr:hypothetical protein BH720_13630 [Desertifilum tharense IPPAS B-1220]